MLIKLTEMGPHDPVIIRIANLIIIAIIIRLLYYILRYYLEYNSLLKTFYKKRERSELKIVKDIDQTSYDHDNRLKVTNKDKNLFALLKNELLSLSIDDKHLETCFLCKFYYSLITKLNILYSKRIKKLLSIILFASMVIIITLYSQFKEIHYISKEISENVINSRHLLMIFSDLFLRAGIMLFSVLILSYVCYLIIKKQYNFLLEKIDFFLSR